MRRREKGKEVPLVFRKQYSGSSKPSMRVKMNARGLDATTVDQTFVILWRNVRSNTVATGRPKNQRKSSASSTSSSQAVRPRLLGEYVPATSFLETSCWGWITRVCVLRGRMATKVWKQEGGKSLGSTAAGVSDQPSNRSPRVSRRRLLRAA